MTMQNHVKKLSLIIFFSLSITTISAQLNKQELSFAGAGDLQMSLGRYQIGTAIHIICRVEGYYSEVGGVYHIAANWGGPPAIVYRGESDGMNERLKFYSYVDPASGGYLFLFATWINWSPLKGSDNEIRFSISTLGVADPNTQGSFSLATEVPSILSVNSSYRNVGIRTTTPEAALHVNGDARFNGTGWFARNNNGANAVALNLGQLNGMDLPIVQVSTSDIGGVSRLNWQGIHWAHIEKFQRNGSSGFKDILQFGGNEGGDHYLSIFSSNDNTQKINLVADGTSFITGNVGIGTSDPGSFKLAVEGKLGARKVVVTQTVPWPDYVFQPTYKLPSLKAIEAFIQQYQHLPDVPTAKEVTENGLDVGGSQAILLKKIEELTLYVIEQNKSIEQLQKENHKQQEEIELLKKGRKGQLK